MQGQQLVDWFNRRPRIGVLSTADGKGRVNGAVFGSPFLMDPHTMAMGIGPNRTLGYLRQNPLAVFVVMEPSERSMDWRGGRFYLRLDEIAQKGPLFVSVQSHIRDQAGAISADTMVAALKFTVQDLRPLIDHTGDPIRLND